MDILEGLNPAQREAVQTIEGPLLILAGPGSGKTRVIAHRIAYLIYAVGVPPYRILAVTFTNKAANEMRERVFRLLGQRAEALTLGTFHATCARILRREAGPAGLDSHFVIYDQADQLALMKQVVKNLGLDPHRYAPGAILAAVSHAKSQLLGPEELAHRGRSYFDEVVARAYQQYQGLLFGAKALDFDDLIMLPVRLFQGNADVLERYQDRYLHVLIDEFQDTNIAQYVLARLLAGKHRNICVVGDPDQSIYSWRSADIRNILNFEYDFPDAKVVYLSQSYRSTQTILDTARNVIAANRQRKETVLWTENEAGVPVTLAEAYNEDDEAEFVVAEMAHLIEKDGLSPRDFAVMYRVNAQSRALEEACVRHGLSYRLVGGTRFYERREVKDILAYLRLVQNPYDGVSLNRIINVPRRGIGERTRDVLSRFAQRLGVPFYTALQLAMAEGEGTPEPPPAFVARVHHALSDFLALLNNLLSLRETSPLPQLIDRIIEATAYLRHLQEERGAFEDSSRWEERWENVQELRSALGGEQYIDLPPAEALSAFLEGVALVAPADEYDEQTPAATLITLHAAKGLEFPVVFIVGLEDGVLPHVRSLDDPAELEEERRLCYVGITRAQKRLYLLRAFRRSLGGSSSPNPPSRFLRDIPPSLITIKSRPGDVWVKDISWPGATPSPRQPARGEPPKPEMAFAPGDRVRHRVFGDGIVVSCTPSQDDQQVVVVFQGQVGVKRLLLSYAPLVKLDNRDYA